MKNILQEQQSSFIEIPLYHNEINFPSFWKVVFKLLLILVIIEAVVFFGLKITETLLLLSTASFIIILVLSYEYNSILFPSCTGVLIFVLGEVYLMTNQNVEWSKSIQEIQIEQFYQKETKYPLVKIIDHQQISITIRYIIPIKFWTKTSSPHGPDYSIHSKSDWNTLIEKLNLN